MSKKLKLQKSLHAFALTLSVVIVANIAVETARAGTAAKLASHEATYRLKLAHVESGAGIQAVEGVMRYRFADACDGWTSENAVAVEYVYDSGASLRSTWTFTSWEAKSGENMRFAVTEKANGRTTDKFFGRASVDASGDKGGKAWIKDEAAGSLEEVIDLPSGTLLPTAHIIALFDAAAAGNPIISRTVFDGTSKDNPYAINAVIGRARAAVGGLGTGAATEVLSTYPMSLAFFQIRARNEVPDFEMSIDYRQDGVAEKVIQTFSDFSLSMMPDTLKFLEPGAC